nr:hypothetical protein [Tanacetum cinerariifolium]
MADVKLRTKRPLWAVTQRNKQSFYVEDGRDDVGVVDVVVVYVGGHGGGSSGGLMAMVMILLVDRRWVGDGDTVTRMVVMMVDPMDRW